MNWLSRVAVIRNKTNDEIIQYRFLVIRRHCKFAIEFVGNIRHSVGKTLTDAAFGLGYQSGWWSDLNTGEDLRGKRGLVGLIGGGGLHPGGCRVADRRHGGGERV